MKELANLPWSIIEAKLISEYAPPHLPALRILNRPATGPTVCLCAMGDIGLSGRVLEHGEMDQLFGEVAPVLRTADITFGNLETSLVDDTLAREKMYAGPLSGAKLLSEAGFNLLHLANNHIADFGKPGLGTTLQAVSEAGIQSLGTGHDMKAAKQLVTTSGNGLQVGWLGCGRTLVDQENDGPFYWEFDEQELLTAVKGARSKVDVLIVSIHLGFMYLDYPSPQHKIMAEQLMNAGVNLILMHHAHVLQGIQVTSQGNLCCYNLGNFLFDSEEGNIKAPIMVREQNEGALFIFTLDQRGVAQSAVFPTWIDDRCRVKWATGQRGLDILARLTRISRDLEGNFVPAFNRQRAERNAGHMLKFLWYHLRSGNWIYVLENLKKIRPEHVGMGISWLRGVLRQMVKGMVP